ncbi:MAG: ATP-binding protein [Prevotella sp.]|nr:ATP-binding protein [Prevotella sp.]
MRLLLKNDISQVPLLADFINQVCNKFALDQSLSFQLNLVLEEAVVNVIQYAFPKGEEHTFTLDVKKEADTITFILRDDGKPFNPLTQAPDVDINLSAEKRQIGGLGIFLVQQMMDEVDYKRTSKGENVLVMRKKSC